MDHRAASEPRSARSSVSSSSLSSSSSSSNLSFSNRIEAELICPACGRLFVQPLLLPCSHSMCLRCAQAAQVGAAQLQATPPGGPNTGHADTSGGSSDSGASDNAQEEGDKLSLLSETDSGVCCSSRPNSCVGTPPSLSNLSSAHMYVITCPMKFCKKLAFLDERGAEALPRACAMERIVTRFSGAEKPRCQMCESGASADVLCEQCQVLYCMACRLACHPDRGPLAKHTLVAPPEERRTPLPSDSLCSEHREEVISLFCNVCKVAVCHVCSGDQRHNGHDVQPLTSCCKVRKAELSGKLQALSERAKSGTAFIQKLKQMETKVHEHYVDFESQVVAQCDAIIEAMRSRKSQLLTQAAKERERKSQRSTGLLQFGIEVLKEGDAAAFLQISHSVSSRLDEVTQSLCCDSDLKPRIAPKFDLRLDDRDLVRALSSLDFSSSTAPSTPVIVREDCAAQYNTITVTWSLSMGPAAECYSLELDDGACGKFKEVYRGQQCLCTVEGLHFNSSYRARVKAVNSAGESAYSECVEMSTSELAYFTLDPRTSHEEMLFSNNNNALTCRSFEDRVAIGTTGFSKGVHYWEFRVDRYEQSPDPTFGVARFDVDKTRMLGKDDKGWGMYIDSCRSWFIHSGGHSSRTDGGVRAMATVGVLLDLNAHALSYYVNGEPHGPIAFHGLPNGVFYPAVSLNRHVQVTLHTGLDLPVDDTDSD